MMVCAVLLVVFALVLNVGLSIYSCNTSVTVQDLACYLHWSCSDNVSTTKFTVQTKDVGMVKWQNVSECVQISSSSCDLSRTFKKFYLYDYVRLGLNHDDHELQWIDTQCSHLKNTKFSAPSVSLLLEHHWLVVKVTFPCAPSVSCSVHDEDNEDDEDYEDNEDDEDYEDNEDDEDYEDNEDNEDNEDESYVEEAPTCCSLSTYFQLNTTVMRYNSLNKSDIEIRTQTVSNKTWTVKFGGLSPGQNYCARAQFKSSPYSDPQCIHVPEAERANVYLLGLCAVLITLLIMLCILGRRCFSTDLRLPKPLLSLLDQELPATTEPSREETLEEDGLFLHLSIVSLHSTISLDTPAIHTDTQDVEETCYYTTDNLQSCLQDCHEEHEDTESQSGDLGKDEHDCSGHYSWPCWSSLPALRPGMVCLLGVSLPLEDSVIPLSSVRVAGVQMDEKRLTNLDSCDDLFSQTDVCETI